MTEQELYVIYYRWTGTLHRLVAEQLNEHCDIEFFPDDYLMKVYSGSAQENEIFGQFHTVPGLSRPHGEAQAVIKLPRPEQNPSQKDLDKTFRALCLAVARVLGIRLSRLGLPDQQEEEKHALPKKLKQ
jgi:hypothetical protein